MGYHGMYREQYMGVSENGMYVYIYTPIYLPNGNSKQGNCLLNNGFRVTMFSQTHMFHHC